MIGSVARKLFGSRNDRLVKGYTKLVSQVNALEERFSKLSDAELQNKTVEFRERLTKGETLDSLIPEAFATVREAGSELWACAITTYS